MNRKGIIIVAAVLAGCANPQEAKTREAAVNPTTQTVTTAQTDPLAQKFNAKNAKAVADLFADDGLWCLSNGKTLAGKDTIQATIDAYLKAGANSMSLATKQTLTLKSGELKVSDFGFRLSDGTLVEGTRFTNSNEGKIASDVWVPGKPAQKSDELDAALANYNQAFNSGDAAQMQSVFSPSASMVLSDGKYVTSTALPGFIEQTSKMGIDTMKTGPAKHHVFEQAAISQTTFSVTLPIPDSPVHLKGKRIVVWERVGETWKVRHEVSWPG